MKFIWSLKFTIIYFLLFVAAQAMDTPFSYTRPDGVIQTFPTQEPWIQNLEAFLKDEERLIKYYGYNEVHKGRYRAKQRRYYEEHQEIYEDEFTAWILGGGMVGLVYGFFWVSGPLLDSPDLKIQIATGMFICMCGVMGALGTWGFIELLSWCIKSPELKECPEDNIKKELEGRIRQELFENNYLTADKLFPVEQGKSLVDQFIKLVMKKNCNCKQDKND